MLTGSRHFACFAGNLPGILVVGLICASGCAWSVEPDPVQPFRDRCGVLARDAEQRGTMTVVGRDGWLFLSPELKHLSAGIFWGTNAPAASKTAKPECSDPLPAILDFNNQLKKIGVSLLVVPVPAKAIIFPDFIPGGPLEPGASAPPRLDPDHQAFYDLLKTNGVKVLDLTPVFLANRFHADGTLYCQQDSHWSGNACVLAAHHIADVVRALPGFINNPPEALTNEWRTIDITGDLWQALGNDKLAKERVRVRQVSRENLAPVEPDNRSAVILLGDSHNLIFHAGDDMQMRGAGLADQLALELGRPVDLVAVRGSGATPARVNLLRRAQKNPGYWSGKKVVIWCFAAREFTESDGWRKVPIAPP